MTTIAAPQKRDRLMAGWLSTLWILVGLLAATSARADIYFWEDSSGTIHFSNQGAPSDAALYMREIDTPGKPEVTDKADGDDSGNLAQALARQQAQTQQRLDEANHKLSRALEKVEDLTASVARSQARAEAAAEAARQAEQEAEAAAYSRYEDREQVIVYAVPHHYRHKDRHHQRRRHNITGRHSRRLNPAKKFKPRYRQGRSRLANIKRHQDQAYHDQIPGPILPPAPHRIPSAYGIR